MAVEPCDMRRCMRRSVRWKLHTASSPERVFGFWSTDEGREQFWAQKSRSASSSFWLSFPDGTEEECRALRTEPPGLFEFTYFGSTVTIELESDGRGGADLTLTNTDVSAADYEEVYAGWLNILLPLKAAADFRVDLRNHDPTRTWRQGYVDQ
jgi:uncharacterized protein YndB with AHSA1/START domain